MRQLQGRKEVAEGDRKGGRDVGDREGNEIGR